MPPAKSTLLGVLLFVAACQQSRTATRDAASDTTKSASNAQAADGPTVPRGSADHPDASQEPTFVQITAFDCEKMYEAPGIPQAVGPITAGISAWRGGGPNGANWNVEDLRCVVDLTTSCSKATIRVAIRVGARIVAEKKLDVGRPGQANVELDVPFDRWRRNLDEPLPSPGPFKMPYKTAIFRASAQITCVLPVPVSAADWKYPAVTADASFVAGFSAGE